MYVEMYMDNSEIWKIYSFSRLNTTSDWEELNFLEIFVLFSVIYINLSHKYFEMPIYVSTLESRAGESFVKETEVF